MRPGLLIICFLLLCSCDLVVANDGLDHEVEKSTHLKKSEQNTKEVEDAHHAMLHHGAASLDYTNQAILHKKENEKICKELDHHKNHLTVYGGMSKNAKTPEVAEHCKNIIEKTKNLVDHYQQKVGHHNKLEELHKQLAQKNTEVAEQHVYLKGTSRKISKLHKQIASIHQKLGKK